jgi:hypothetical protein
MASVHVPPHPPFDADLPVRLILSPVQALASDLDRRVTAAADLFSRFARGGAFPEVKPGTAARVSLAGGICYVDLQDVPADQAALGVLGRMLLALPDKWGSINVDGTPARRPERALEPLPSSLSLVPGRRHPLSVKCEIEPVIDWYNLEITRHSGWRDEDLPILQDGADLWMDVCRAGGLSEITPGFNVTPGSVGMDPPQVGDDCWSAQIGSNDLNFGALSSLINILDHISRTRVLFDELSVT